MSTAISICNLALGHLGVTEVITALTDDSEEGRACNRHYDQDRKFVLASFPWNFATKFETLSLVSTGEVQGFTYAYELPSDLLKARKIFQASPPLGPLDFKIVGTQLWTDMEDAILEFTYDLNVENQFSPDFITAFSHKLANSLAMPLTRKMTLAKEQMTAYFGFLSLSAASNAREGLDSTEKTDDFLRARS